MKLAKVRTEAMTRHQHHLIILCFESNDIYISFSSIFIICLCRFSHNRFWRKTAWQWVLMLLSTIVSTMPRFPLQMSRMHIIRRDFWHRQRYVIQWARGNCMKFSANVWHFLEVCRWVDGYGLRIMGKFRKYFVVSSLKN